MNTLPMTAAGYSVLERELKRRIQLDRPGDWTTKSRASPSFASLVLPGIASGATTIDIKISSIGRVVSFQHFAALGHRPALPASAGP
jgi:hypothetical protein